MEKMVFYADDPASQRAPERTNMRDEVLHQLALEPELDATEIGVAVDDGIVTLTGFVENVAERIAAARATKRVRGIKVVANDVRVRPTILRTDHDLAQAVLDALDAHVQAPQRVSATVTEGWVTLEGRVADEHESQMVVAAVRKIAGVIGVTNCLEVAPKADADEIAARIGEILRQMAEIDAQRICVEVDEGRVRLSGEVQSLAEKEAAERVAWNAPGVVAVENEVTVRIR